MRCAMRCASKMRWARATARGSWVGLIPILVGGLQTSPDEFIRGVPVVVLAKQIASSLSPKEQVGFTNG